MQLRTKILYSILMLALVLGLAPVASGFNGFHDDTNEPCLGGEDPFCADDGGGGDTGAPCRWCLITTDDNGDPVTASCETGSQGEKTECEASLGPNGASCQLSGDDC